MSDSSAELLRRATQALKLTPQERFGVAVSGGGDSLALLHLLAEHAASAGAALEAVTVNHQLRAASLEEAQKVAQICATLGVAHTILTWQGWNGQGNLQDHARRGRYRLMTEWAQARGINRVYLGHTRDDVAEGFLMRLARGSGLDGLSSMEDVSPSGLFVRPLLGIGRDELRQYLTERGQAWVEDPSNADDRFERVRMRRALTTLEEVGISKKAIAETAHRLREARSALEGYVCDAIRPAVTFDGGDVLLVLAPDDPEQQAKWPLGRDETARRVLRAAVTWVSGAAYPPRHKSLQPLELLQRQTDTTCGGCRFLFKGNSLRVTREWRAVAETRVPADQIWDGRWQLIGPAQPGCEIAALGEAGLAHCPDRKKTGRPAASLIASPAVWQGQTLIAAPLAGLANGWEAELIRPTERFFAAV